MILSYRSMRAICRLVLWTSSIVLPMHASLADDVSSYAISAVDGSGSTGAASVALGVPDYRFINDAALAFGGTSTDVFEPGESTVLAFEQPLQDIAGQHDLVVSAFVGGLGATDTASVQVEVSGDGANFVPVASFDTAEARNRSQDSPENDHEGVKHFWIDFAGETDVTHVRLTNLAGSAEGFRLDSVEGLHPRIGSPHAFEVRIERYRPDFNQRFLIRIKNLSDQGGVPIREFRIDRPLTVQSTLEDTDDSLFGLDGEFLCVENCIPDNGPRIPFSRHVWSTDGLTTAPAGEGLAPGKQAAHERFRNFDLDTADETYLSGYTFTIVFADGFTHTFDYDADVLKEIGNLYQKYQYSDPAPAESGPRPVDYYQFADDPALSIATFSNPASVGSGHTPGVDGALVFDSQNFVEEGLRVEGFWAPNDETGFVRGHFHQLWRNYETSHGWESSPGLGPDRNGIYISRVDGGAFDLISLDYQVQGVLSAARIWIGTSFDPTLPPGPQLTAFDVLAEPDFETLQIPGFTGVTQLFILAELSEDDQERIAWDNLVMATSEPLTLGPIARAGPDQVLTDSDDDGFETAMLDGSASSDDRGIVSWTWSRDGNELGTGSMLDVDLAAGDHLIDLRVIDVDGNVNHDQIRVRVQPGGGRPFAEAGPAITVSDEDLDGSETVTLDGSGSFDSDGVLTTWDWSESGSPLGSGETLDVTLSVGTHVIDLLVTDDSAQTDADSVTVIVNPDGGVAPIADAGPDQNLLDADESGFEPVLLDGTGSFDADGSIVVWEWREGATLLGSGSTLSVDLAVGAHEITLVVVDDSGALGSDTVLVSVFPGGDVVAPVYLAHETTEQAANTTVHALSTATLPIQAGDLMVAQLCVDGSSALAITCPAGWTQAEHAIHPTNAMGGVLCHKVAGSSDEGLTSVTLTTSSSQQSQGGVILLAGQDAVAPIENVASASGTSVSPLSPALAPLAAPTSLVLRFMCADGGRVTEGVGFPAGMEQDLWLLESADGGSGPASGGAAIHGAGAPGTAEWTDALASSDQSIGFTLAIAGGTGAPIASAGPDVTLVDLDEDGSESHLLDGSGSLDPDGSVVSWDWSEGGVPLGSGETLLVSFPIGTHVVDLRVTDDEGGTDTDTVVVTVEMRVPMPPVADAGADANLTDFGGDGSESHLLDGSGSSDPDGSVVSWDWSEGGVPLGSGETLLVSFPLGSHTVDLLVTDDEGLTASDSMVVNVIADPGLPPVADAGADANLVDLDEDGFEPLTLDGSGSSDPEGPIASWDWSEGGAPLGSGETLAVSLAVGTHDIDLLVTDADGNTAVDAVRVVVNPGGGVLPPLYIDHQTSEQVSNATSHVLDVSALPINAGDLMVAHLCVDGGGSVAITCPAGWTPIQNAAHSSGSVVGALCYRQADASDELATSYTYTTSVAQHSQSGVILLAGHDAQAPIESSAVRSNQNDTSPESPALGSAPEPTSLVLRFTCADGGRVTEGTGFPAGMTDPLWMLESADGGSGPVSGGAAIEGIGASGAAEWTDALASAEQSVSFTLALAGGTGAPVASAGADISLVDSDDTGFEDALLDGSGSFDADGVVVGWDWSEGGAPLGSGETLLFSFGVGVHSVDLLVTDDEGNTAVDSLMVVVNAGGTIAPVADAGPDQLLTDDDESGLESVTLDGSGSSDSDGMVVSWDWSEGGSPLGSGETLVLELGVGTHDIDLLVTDDDGNSASDSVSVTILPGGGPGRVAHETSAETANTTTHTLAAASLPIQPGDLMIAAICVDGNGSTTVSCPAGWIALENATHPRNGVLGAVCYREADAADAAATSFQFTTTVSQQSQSGLILIDGHESGNPIETSAQLSSQSGTSPESPATPLAPSPGSLVLRLMCANGGQVSEGSGFPVGMTENLWVLESGDGFSGPVSGGAAIGFPGAGGSAIWNGALATSQQALGFTVVVRPAAQ